MAPATRRARKRIRHHGRLHDLFVAEHRARAGSRARSGFHRPRRAALARARSHRRRDVAERFADAARTRFLGRTMTIAVSSLMAIAAVVASADGNGGTSTSPALRE